MTSSEDGSWWEFMVSVSLRASFVNCYTPIRRWKGLCGSWQDEFVHMWTNIAPTPRHWPNAISSLQHSGPHSPCSTLLPGPHSFWSTLPLIHTPPAASLPHNTLHCPHTRLTGSQLANIQHRTQGKQVTSLTEQHSFSIVPQEFSFGRLASAVRPQISSYTRLQRSRS